ncbi:MAG: hypothetical protein Q8941_15940 [Bacteroidota bacterium]|nr:hypothetical protein [Bacteroidota bacterium]
MGDGGYKIRNQGAIHFITFAIVVPIIIGRIDVFTRKIYRDIVLTVLGIASLKEHCYCIAGVS